MKKLFLFLSIVLLGNNLYSQLQDRIWIFGRPFSGTTNATLYFGNLSNPIVNLPNGQPNNITVNNGWEQWAVVTNPLTGDLIFYTDGKNVFDSLNNLVSSLDLGASVSGSQPVAISPVPHSDAKSSYKQYYIFSNSTGGFPTYCDIGIITYRTYNVVSQTFGTSQNLPGIYGTSDVTEGMKIIPCDSSADILWLIVSLYPDPGYETKYMVYKIDKTVITYQGEYDMGPQKKTVNNCPPIVYITYTKANTSPGITNIGFALQYSSAVFTCQFDNTNGQFLTNTTKVCNTGYTSSIPSVYNVEFSPNGKFLYYSVYKCGSSNELYQIDLQDSVLTPTLIHSYSYTYAGGLKLGPDGLIYHIYDNGYYSNVLRLGRILQPDVKYIPGVTIYNQFYEENFKTYNNVYGFGLCEFLVLPTAPSGISDETPDSDITSISVYPNPVHDVITIDYNLADNSNVTIDFYNITGKLIDRINTGFQTNGKHSFNYDLNNDLFPAGVYYIRLSNNITISTIKLVKIS